MKTRIFAAVMALGLLAGTSAFAQTPAAEPTPKKAPLTAEQIAQKRTDRMTEELKLNDAQSKQIYDYNLQTVKAQQTKMAAMREQMKAQREQMKNDRTAREAKMKEILTPDQFTQWQADQQHAREAMMHRGGGHGHGMQMHQGKCGHKGMQGKACCCGKCGGDKANAGKCGDNCKKEAAGTPAAAPAK